MSLIQYMIITLIDILLIYNELFLVNADKNNRLIFNVILVIFAMIFLSAGESRYIYYAYYFIALFQLSRASNIKLFSATSFITYVVTIYLIVKNSVDSIKVWEGITINTGIFIVMVTIIWLMTHIINQNKLVEEAKNNFCMKVSKELMLLNNYRKLMMNWKTTLFLKKGII